VCAYDFVFARLLDGTNIRFLTVVDEYTRECLCLRVGYGLKSDDVMDALIDLFITRAASPTTSACASRWATSRRHRSPDLISLASSPGARSGGESTY